MEVKQLTLGDLLNRMETAAERYGVSHPMRSILTDAAQILIQQSHALDALRQRLTLAPTGEPSESSRLVTLD